MKILIIFFGLLIITMGLLMTLRPKPLLDYLLDHSGDTWLHVLAAAVRIIIGAVLILHAGHSRFPLVLEILGWITLAAGVGLALVPPSKFRKLIEWAAGKFGGFVRIAGLVAWLFGAFLIYAVW